MEFAKEKLRDMKKKEEECVHTTEGKPLTNEGEEKRLGTEMDWLKVPEK